MALLLSALVLGACGTSGAADPDVTEPPATTTNTASYPDPTTTTTTTAPLATTTTAPRTTTTKPSAVLADAEGSGCTPGPGNLPDGKWFGYVVEARADAVRFDLACWFTGDAAGRAAREDGEESPPPNDYYVRNVNRTIRLLNVADRASVVWYPQLGDPTSEATVAYADWLLGIEDRGPMPGLWVEVKSGQMVAIHEQWVP